MNKRPPISVHLPYRKLPFYTYSSRNKQGNRPNPIIIQRREQILNMYWEHRTLDEIAITLDIAIDTVRAHILRARRLGDERAKRRMGIKRIVQAQARRKQIIELSRHGYSPAQIAKQVNAHIRLVQMRLKEAENALHESQ